MQGSGTKDSFTEKLGSFRNTRLIRELLLGSSVEGWPHPWDPESLVPMDLSEDGSEGNDLLTLRPPRNPLVLGRSQNPYLYML